MRDYKSRAFISIPGNLCIDLLDQFGLERDNSSRPLAHELSRSNVNHFTPSMEIAKLIKVVRCARHIGNVKRPDGKWIDLMTPQAFQITLEVALRPGVTMKQLMDASGLALGSVSRNLMALGEWHRLDMPGLGLIETVNDPQDTRRKVAFLTKKGRKFVSEILLIQTGERVAIEASRSSNATQAD